VLKAILAFAVLSTLLHNAHNTIEVDQYPTRWVSDSVIQVAAVITWPIFSAIGLYAYRLYRRRRFPRAQFVLTLYAVYCMSTLLHFTQGPVHLPPFWYGTIFTDGLAGLSVLAFAIWSVRDWHPHATGRAVSR
jgi:hypothetical protein